MIAPADMTDAQLETARANYLEAVTAWAANGTTSDLTRYSTARYVAVTVEIAKRAR